MSWRKSVSRPSVGCWLRGSLTGSEYTIKRSLNAMLHYYHWTGNFQTIKSLGSAVNALAYLKSFYRHNYVPLRCKAPVHIKIMP